MKPRTDRLYYSTGVGKWGLSFLYKQEEILKSYRDCGLYSQVEFMIQKGGFGLCLTLLVTLNQKGVEYYTDHVPFDGWAYATQRDLLFHRKQIKTIQPRVVNYHVKGEGRKMIYIGSGIIKGNDMIGCPTRMLLMDGSWGKLDPSNRMRFESPEKAEEILKTVTL
jgi:hypothetical protein